MSNTNQSSREENNDNESINENQRRTKDISMMMMIQSTSMNYFLIFVCSYAKNGKLDSTKNETTDDIVSRYSINPNDVAKELLRANNRKSPTIQLSDNIGSTVAILPSATKR